MHLFAWLYESGWLWAERIAAAISLLTACVLLLRRMIAVIPALRSVSNVAQRLKNVELALKELESASALEQSPTKIIAHFAIRATQMIGMLALMVFVSSAIDNYPLKVSILLAWLIHDGSDFGLAGVA
jgi:hypothetical protein